MKYIKTFEGKKSNEDPFIQAAKRGSNSVVLKYIKNKQNINIKSKIDGKTALMNAAINNFLIVVDTLIKAGADVNLQDPGGRTALMMASTNKIIDLLLKSGADVNILNNDNQTIIFEFLGFYSSSETLIMLLEKFLTKGLNLDQKDFLNRNFYEYLKYHQTKSAYYLLQYYLGIEQYMNEKFPKYKEEWDFNQDVEKYNL